MFINLSLKGYLHLENLYDPFENNTTGKTIQPDVLNINRRHKVKLINLINTLFEIICVNSVMTLRLYHILTLIQSARS